MSTMPREPYLGCNPVMYVDALALIPTDPTEMGTVARLGTVGHGIQ